ncbi:hypothetical protein [Lapillicoccus jejuensis]|uniref:Uncharacterized protein n=1 Tax=Lapillicoccus jejuensis TaxID=402171 RepID=A0A542E2T8_9MICO|nr:hypothetical protein [Lapillicoccus jejuensis]TQJ09647.1 hypothetical protein FB458_2760 [Lapillicoccus jejuensis]
MYPLSHTVAHDVVRATDAHRLEGFRRWTRRHGDARPTTRTDATGPRRRTGGR